jgi:hypothetical protein
MLTRDVSATGLARELHQAITGGAKLRRVAHQFFLYGARSVAGKPPIRKEHIHHARELGKPLACLSNPGMREPPIALPP